MTTPIIPEETEGQLYTRLGIDGRAWAEKMGKRFNVSMEELLPWTCSMIMAAYDKDRHPRPKQPTTNPHALAMEEALVALEIMFIQFDALVQETGTHLPDYEQGDLRDIATARKTIASLTKALGR